MEIIKKGNVVGWQKEFVCRTVFGKGCGALLKVGQKDIYKDFLVTKATFCCPLCATEVDVEYPYHLGVEVLGKRPSEEERRAIIRRFLGVA